MAINVSFEHVFPAQKGTAKMAILARLCTYSETTEVRIIKRPGAFLLSGVAVPQLYLLIALLD